MSETPQEIVTRFLPRIIPDQLAEAIRALLADDTSLKLANEQYVEQRNQALREQEKAEAEVEQLRETLTKQEKYEAGAWLTVQELRNERDTLKLELEKLRGPK